MYIDLPNLLNLSIVPGIGAMKIRSLIARFKTPEDVFKAKLSELCSVEGIDTKIAQNIKSFHNFGYGETQYEKLISRGASIVTFWDDSYPILLKKINDPPVFLFVNGELQPIDRYAIAVVGTRIPSDYGKIVTEKLCSELINNGITVVSGLARGVDTIAHQTAVKKSGRTIAVIGSGIDVIYPAENLKLSQMIAENGAVVTEFGLETKPDAMNFPKRNRIIAGLSLGTIVVEAGEKSGALITANLALDYNREVFAIPGNINSPKSKGANQLIKEGAKLVTSIGDVLEELQSQLKTRKVTAISINWNNFAPQERMILEKLSEKPVHIDELARIAKKQTGEVLSILLALEFKDMVKQLPGKLFVRSF